MQCSWHSTRLGSGENAVGSTQSMAHLEPPIDAKILQISLIQGEL